MAFRIMKFSRRATVSITMLIKIHRFFPACQSRETARENKREKTRGRVRQRNQGSVQERERGEIEWVNVTEGDGQRRRERI